MTPFQSLSFSGGGGIPTSGQVLCRHSASRGSLGDNKLGYPVFLCEDCRYFVYFQVKSIYFLSRRP
jgi:hypothetical protein